MNFRMNSPTGKSILAKARNGDFAHPGEEEAVQLVAAEMKESCVRRVLDVGCGRGGTAAWFQQNNFGHVFGIDVDEESINYARAAYPDVQFVALDVGKLAEWQSEPFDFAYLFNSFYAFPDQPRALRGIRAVCRSGADLCIFDYAKTRDALLPAALGSEIGSPIVIEDLPNWLAEAGWIPISSEDWTDRYVDWYDTLLAAFERDRPWISESFGDGWAEFVLDWYGSLRAALAARTLRGMVFRATTT